MDQQSEGKRASNDESNEFLRAPIFPAWTRFTQCIHNGLTTGVVLCAMTAAHRPWQTIVVLTLLSLFLLMAGFVSGGFHLELDIMKIFTPVGCQSAKHLDWIQSEYNETRLILLFFHNDGNNVLHKAQTRRVVEAVNTLKSTPGLDALCAQGSYIDFDDEPSCRIWGVSGYWHDHSLEAFDAVVQSDQDVRLTVASNRLANGAPIFHDAIVGNWVKEPLSDGDGFMMTSAQSYFVRLDIPDLDEKADLVEEEMLNRVDALRRRWIEEDVSKPEGDPTRLSMDIKSVYAYQLESMKLIMKDMYLVAFAAMAVVALTCLVFYRHDDEQAASRTMLGIVSILTITMSLMTGCGVMFLARVPYTTCTQMLPYVVYGVGLDDTFIIMGAFFQVRDTDTPVEARIERTMKQVGWSIALTTITTVVAFVLGWVTSSFPGVQWLCLYAAVIISIDFFFQITYFIAWLVLDERRIEANRRDGICCCLKRNSKCDIKNEIIMESDKEDRENKVDSNAIANNQSETSLPLSYIESDSDTDECPARIIVGLQDIDHGPRKSLQERVMKLYAEFLLRPPVKIVVLFLFAALFALCAYSATLLEQHFDLNDYVADDSYLKAAYSNIDEYSSIVRDMQVYFRDVDQTSPEIQQQMRDYIEGLEALEQIGTSDVSLANMSAGVTGEVRPFCWVRDFQEWQESQYADDPFIMAALANMTFIDKLEFALNDRTVREVYGQDIVRDSETGNITSSRCTLFLRNLDLKSVPDQIDMLMDQRAVSMAQPINQVHRDLAFFSFDLLFLFWESSARVINELISTSIAGVVAVAFLAFVFVPHWTATLFVVPLICILYIDLLGTIRFFGLYINPLTYVCVVVSIGLLVDFLIHVLLRYCEATPGKSRDDRVKETLETMGVSILVGGLTTLVAAVPLAFSSAEVFKTIFYSFFAMISLGLTHGLILMPVLLSYCGPTVSVIGQPLQLNPPSHLVEKDTPIPLQTQTSNQAVSIVEKYEDGEESMVLDASSTKVTILLYRPESSS